MGFPESRIVCIPNGVSTQTGSKATYGQVINVVTAGRLSREKGVDVLLKAWAEVMEQNKDLRLLILGDGPLWRELVNLSKSLEITNSVVFTGIIRDISEYLVKADLFILPSRAEGMSNALLEAMGYGVPCIATSVGGNGELLNPKGKEVPLGGYVSGENGLLVRPDDARGLSEAILYLVRNRETREQVGRKGRAMIEENYSIELIADRYIALYQHLLGRKR
jgi:glycosyltransferase involved in cell wall biosynthesis